jgi:hypothetical protein
MTGSGPGSSPLGDLDRIGGDDLHELDGQGSALTECCGVVEDRRLRMMG